MVVADARESCAQSRSQTQQRTGHNRRRGFVRSFPSALPNFGDFKGKGKGGEEVVEEAVLTPALS